MSSIALATFRRPPPHNLPMGELTSRAHVCFPPATMATAVLPSPRSTEGSLAPISAREKQEQQSEDVGPACVTVVGLGGQGPLAAPPRFELSPSPSCPESFRPQHLRVASSCGKKQPRITNRCENCTNTLGASCAQGLEACISFNVVPPWS